MGSSEVKFFLICWHLVAFIDSNTHLYKVIRHQLSYILLWNTQHIYESSGTKCPVQSGYYDSMVFSHVYTKQIRHVYLTTLSVWSQSRESNPGLPGKKPRLCHLSHHRLTWAEVKFSLKISFSIQEMGLSLLNLILHMQRFSWLNFI